MEGRLLLAARLALPVAAAAPVVISSDEAIEAIDRSFPGDADRVSSYLLSAYFRGPGAPQLSGVARAAMDDLSGSDDIPFLTDPAGRVGVVITATDPEALAPALRSIGMQVAAALPSYHRIEGFLPLDMLPAASTLGDSGLLGIEGVARPKTSAGTVTSQADNVLEGDRVRALPGGYNGAGVKIGVLSDSYDKSSLVTRASASISSGNLPSGGVQVLQDYNSSGTSSAVADEGRAMLELIYDIAPGASLGFATAFISESGFATNIQALASAGYTIISDDVFYFDEPYFQDGIVSQAVNNVYNSGVAYYTSAGNQGNFGYDSGASAAYASNPLAFASQTITPITASASSYYDWDPGSNTDTLMSITIPRNQSVQLDFQWDQPFYTTNGVTTNLDFYLLSVNTSTGAMTTRAQVTTNNVTNQTPYSLLSYTNTLSGTSATTTFNLVVRNTNGGLVPGRIKFIDMFGSATVVYNEYFTRTGTIGGHASALGAQAVAAAAFYEQNTPEDFSSIGPVTMLFNADGTRKAAPEFRAKPDILATDGADTSFFYPGDDVDGNGFNNFFGTSAAAPDAAAVAALVKQANPTWTNAQIVARLKATADPTAGGGDVNAVGAGLISAYRAIFGDPVVANVASTTPVFDGFEFGALGAAWETYKSGSGVALVGTANGPSNSTYHLVLGSNLGYGTTGFTGIPQLNEAILHLNLAGKRDPSIRFSAKRFSGEADNAMPGSFTGHGNYDGVSLSVDGVNWYRIVSLTSPVIGTSYSDYVADLAAVARANGLTLTADTRIKFQQYGANAFAPGVTGIAFDNILASEQSYLTANVIDSGAAQRSSVRSITVDFAGNITGTAASAFTLTRSDGLVVPVSFALSPIAGGTRATLTFSGPGLDGSSLADGRYTLQISGIALVDDGLRLIDVDGDGVDGGTKTISFYRFFGDSNGDGLVDATDYLAFLAAYRTGVASGTGAIFDSNNDGVFTAADLNAFLLRFNKRRLP